MLALRTLIPPLTARTLDGGEVRAWDFKQKRNLVVVFLRNDDAASASFLDRLANSAAPLGEHEAVAIIVFPGPPPRDAFPALPPQVIVASDVSGRAHRAWLGDDAFGPAGLARLGLFVTDRFGELVARWTPTDASALPGIREILSWLAQIQVACEECGVSHWPAE